MASWLSRSSSWDYMTQAAPSNNSAATFFHQESALQLFYTVNWVAGWLSKKQNFSKVSTRVILYRKWSSDLTFEKLCLRLDMGNLQHTATGCNTLQHALYPAAKIRLSDTGGLHTLQHTATHYNTLQHTFQIWDQMARAFTANYGARNNKLQHTVKQCNTMQQHIATHCNTLWLTVTHCNTLFISVTRASLAINGARGGNSAGSVGTHTATHCNTLQHTFRTPD